jgi:hypothetical protein
MKKNIYLKIKNINIIHAPVHIPIQKKSILVNIVKVQNPNEVHLINTINIEVKKEKKKALNITIIHTTKIAETENTKKMNMKEENTEKLHIQEIRKSVIKITNKRAKSEANVFPKKNIKKTKKKKNIKKNTKKTKK